MLRERLGLYARSISFFSQTSGKAPAAPEARGEEDELDLGRARDFLRDNHRAVFMTRRRDGGIQSSLVGVGVDAQGRAIISSRETAYKTRNLRRDPRAAACVFTERFYGPWIQIEGTASILSLPEAMEPLVDYYRRLAGEHPDWDEYREAMEKERRVLIRIDIERAGPVQRG